MKILLLALLLTGCTSSASNTDYDALFQKHGAAHGVDWRLLKVLAEVESHMNPRAENPDGFSAGLMQIHCRDDGRGGCSNKFYIDGWPVKSRAQLYDPDTSVHLGAQIIAWNIRTYGLHKGIAIYNQWSARHTPNGVLFPNQFYVDKVLNAYREAQR